MAGGIGGFAEGFSSGLGQGMGIIQSVRQDKRAEAAQQKQFEAMDHSMKLQDEANTRANAGEARAADEFEFNKNNIRPWTAQKAKMEVDALQKNIEIMGYEAAMKDFQVKHQGEAWAMQTRAANDAHVSSVNGERRADQNLAFTMEMGRANLKLAQGRDARESEQQNISLAASLMVPYTEMVSRGITPPPGMMKIIANSPIGVSQQLEFAKAAESFPTILQGAAKHDFSFMRNGEMRESAYSLARPVGMRIARQKGYDAGSARVVGITPDKSGAVWMDVVARDKNGQFKQFRYGVNPDHLAGEMEKSARSGEALRQHPAFQQLQQSLPGYQAAFGGDVRKTAGDAWDSQVKAANDMIQQDPDSPAGQAAQKWLNANANRDQYIENVAAGAARTQNARGDAYTGDWNRVSSTVQRWTQISDPNEQAKRGNAAMAAMSKVARAGINPNSAPTIYKMANDAGWADKHGDPAFLVNMWYQIQQSPQAKREVQSLLSGGSGKSRPSSGGLGSPIGNAAAAVTALYPMAKITEWQRDPNSKLGKANPSSWHNHSRAAVDVRPIPGMSFQTFVGGLKSAGYKIIEGLNEVGAGRSKHATGDHWHVVLGK